jgi:hypothetical protein
VSDGKESVARRKKDVMKRARSVKSREKWNSVEFWSWIGGTLLDS